MPTSTSTAQVEKNLYKLISVLDVRDVTNERTVMRDLALIKVGANSQTAPTSCSSPTSTGRGSWT